MLAVRARKAAYGDVFVDGRGHLHVVYVALGSGKPKPDMFGDSKNSIYYTRSTDGGKTFSKPERVSEADPVPFYFSNAQVVFDDKREELTIVYPRGTSDGKWDIVIARRSTKSPAWQRFKANDDEPCASHMVPTAAFDRRTGTLHLIWAENRGGKGRMAYTSCAQGSKRCAANEALSEQVSARYSFTRHATMWRGEYDALLIDEAHKRIHAVWTQAVDEGGVPTSRVFHASGAL